MSKEGGKDAANKRFEKMLYEWLTTLFVTPKYKVYFQYRILYKDIDEFFGVCTVKYKKRIDGEFYLTESLIMDIVIENTQTGDKFVVEAKNQGRSINEEDGKVHNENNGGTAQEKRGCCEPGSCVSEYIKAKNKSKAYPCCMVVSGGYYQDPLKFITFMRKNAAPIEFVKAAETLNKDGKIVYPWYMQLVSVDEAVKEFTNSEDLECLKQRIIDCIG